MQTAKSQQRSSGKKGSKVFRSIRRRRKRTDNPAQQHPLLQLQPRIGNQAVGHIIQAKLKIGQPGDRYEQEADRVAAQVVNLDPPAPAGKAAAVQRQTADEPEMQMQPEAEDKDPEIRRQPMDKEDQMAQRQPEMEEKDPEMQRQPMDEEQEMQRQPMDEEDQMAQRQPEEELQTAPKGKAQTGAEPAVSPGVQASIHSLQSSGGRPLSPAARAYFEPRFGVDFSRVRVHTDTRAAKTSRSINARAFTVGRDIAFGAGEYSPGTDTGKKLLAHELTHVLQQHKTSGSADIVSKLSARKTIQRSTNKENIFDTFHNIYGTLISKSYFFKQFTINNNDARVWENDLSKYRRYKQGDNIPPAKSAGDYVVIPRGGGYHVTDAREKRNQIFVNIENWGWTRATNLAGKFVGEALGISQAKWESEAPNHKTISDRRAFIRERITAGEKTYYKPTGRRIPQGAFVIVKAESQDTIPKGKFIKVAFTKKAAGKTVEDSNNKQVWTARSNLEAGWADIKGPHAAWKSGKYIGQYNYVQIVDKQGHIQKISPKMLSRFKMLQKAAAADGIDLQLSSGFREYPKQEKLYEKWKAGATGYLPAAKPGRSPHQWGRAIDFSGVYTNPQKYRWLQENAWKFGFIRTDKRAKEKHHWEYVPQRVRIPDEFIKNGKAYQRIYYGTWTKAYIDILKHP
ncbi:MAG: DUF4157 domain-containing protein [Sinomicrobium sp.]|nr:DUF4157 domain-containing protein [Sinomicrobium sp.]